MPSPAWENLDEFLSGDDFATQAIITMPGGSTRTVLVIFDDPYLNAQLGEYQLDTSEPRITGKETDFAGVQHKCAVVIDGAQYVTLTATQPDGTGMAMLRLARQE